jgi:hypothetical protein
MRIIKFEVPAVILSVLSLSAQAMPVQWHLSNVTFDDGGTANGSFIYDADVGAFGTYSNILITTTAGTNFSGGTYGDLYDGTSTLIRTIETLEGDLNGVGFLSMLFDSPLTNSGGTVAFFDPPGAEGPCDDFECSASQEFRFINGGTVNGAAVIPILPALWLYGSALGLLGWMRRRKTI